MIMKYPFTKTNRLSVIERLGGFDWNTFGQELDKWKDGQKGHLAIIKERKQKSAEQLGYYYGVILPIALKSFQEDGDTQLIVFIKGNKITLPCNKDAVDMTLKLRYAESTGGYMGKAEMSMAECSAFEDWVIRWLVQWMDCHIPPSDPNWRDKPHEDEK